MVKFASLDSRRQGLILGLCATVIGALVAAVVVLFPHGDDGAETAVRPAAQAAAQSARTYVALGSSYASGPGGQYAMNSGRCGRSSNNYPHQVAAARGYRLVDVSCGGSVTGDILRSGKRPAQIDAVTPDTALVTITTGGNDIDYIGRIISMGCLHATPEQARISGRNCGPNRHQAPEPGIDQYTRVGSDLVAVIQAVRARAPQARILLVEYPPAIDPTAPTCALLPLSPDQIAETGRIWNGLAQATVAAAQLTGVTLVAAPDAMAHTVCSPQPWINGFEPPVPFHPNAQGKRAMANMVLAAIG